MNRSTPAPTPATPDSSVAPLLRQQPALRAIGVRVRQSAPAELSPDTGLHWAPCFTGHRVSQGADPNQHVHSALEIGEFVQIECRHHH
jgi:hypothetical protein